MSRGQDETITVLLLLIIEEIIQLKYFLGFFGRFIT
jgi:hypothetical protein